MPIRAHYCNISLSLDIRDKEKIPVKYEQREIMVEALTPTYLKLSIYFYKYFFRLSTQSPKILELQVIETLL